MPEPNSSMTAAIMAAVIALAGPLLGPYTLILIFSAGGSLVAASEAENTGRLHVLRYVLRGVLFGLAFATIAADELDKHLGIVGHVSLAPVSVTIGLFAHRWRQVPGLAVDLWSRLRGVPRA